MSAFSLRRTLRPDPAPAVSRASEAAQIDPRRYLCLAVVVAAQFMFVVDAFIVNVAIPSIRADLTMSEAGIEAVVALYQIAFATLVITGGRLGDLRGRRNVFLLGLLGFTAASIWCGLARSGGELIAARLAQGAAAALMSPQVLATIHTLYPDAPAHVPSPCSGFRSGLGGAAGVMVRRMAAGAEFVRAWLAFDLLRQRTDWTGDRNRGLAPAARRCGADASSAWTWPAPPCCSSDFWA